MDFRFLRLDILLPFLISPLALLAAFKAYQRPSQKNEVLNFLHALLFALRPLHNLLNGLFRSESSIENDGTAFALYSLQTSLIMGITLIQGFNLPRALLLPFFCLYPVPFFGGTWGWRAYYALSAGLCLLLFTLLKVNKKDEGLSLNYLCISGFGSATNFVISKSIYGQLGSFSPGIQLNDTYFNALLCLNSLLHDETPSNKSAGISQEKQLSEDKLKSS